MVTLKHQNCQRNRQTKSDAHSGIKVFQTFTKMRDFVIRGNRFQNKSTEQEVNHIKG